MASSFPGVIDNFTDPLSGSALNSPSHSAQHADLNDAAEKIETYMGLVKVIPTGATNGTVGATGTVTIGNAVSSVTVSGCFSALYNAYKIILTGGAASAQGDIKMTLGATVAGYYQAVIYTAWNNTVAAASTNNGASWERAGITETISPTLNVELVNPFLSERTTISGSFIGADSTRVGGWGSGFIADTTSYTAFTITPSTGTLTGGSLTIYGYRI
jgi:hypothetical protein